MHILVVNDDGPPSPASPYIQDLISELEQAGHVVSVVLPDIQRSWIGKAHMITETVQCEMSSEPKQNGWVLVSSTPAACVQIGLHHFFKERGQVDLVISGPNFGRNITSVYALSSGTLGGALEAALCGHRAIALSFSKSSNLDSSAIAATTRHSIKIIEELVKKWPAQPGIDLFSINMPLTEDIASREVVFTSIFQNNWAGVSPFVETDTNSQVLTNGVSEDKTSSKRFFRWMPQLDRVDDSKTEAVQGEDAWAAVQGHTSITPLSANYLSAVSSLSRDNFNF